MSEKRENRREGVERKGTTGIMMKGGRRRKKSRWKRG